jgi:hypothetical protein
MAPVQAKALNVIQHNAYAALGTFENIGVAIWKSATTIELVGVLGAALQKLGQEHEGGIGLIQVVGDTHPALPSDVHRALQRMLVGAAGHLVCSTVVFEGQGFRAAAVRSVVTGLAMLARLPFPHHIFATVPIAVDWEIAHLKPVAPNLRRDDVVRAIEGLRARINVQGSAISARP